MQPERNPLVWVGNSLKELSAFPQEVKDVMGFALHLAQLGEKHPRAEPLRGYRGAGVLEIVDDSVGDTYRAVYTVRFTGRVYVLHAFQKKSTHGIRPAARDIRLIEQRLREAEELHQKWLEEQERTQ
jgi:phage-related protein